MTQPCRGRRTVKRSRAPVVGRMTAAFMTVVVVAGACAAQPSTSGTSSASPGALNTLRLGYFPTITHATAIVGVESGIFARALGPGVTLDTSSFAAGSTAVEALLSGAIDATYVGPNPAINAYAKSGGEAIRIIAGATSGGAFLVVKPNITAAADLKGKRLATPQLGNTQDVALRTWLLDHGLATDPQGGGDVSILPQDNAQTLATFIAGQIDGAWLPEPWATRLVLEGNGKVLVDEATLWPAGRYVTTHLIVRTDYLRAHPDIIRALLVGDVEANELVNADPAHGQQLTNQGIERITGNKLADAVIKAAWKNLTFTVDPIASSLKASADDAVKVGLLKPVDLTGIYDLSLLNEVLKAAGQPPVNGL